LSSKRRTAGSERRRLDPKEREAEITRAAIAFFARHGFDGSTRDFAASAGITQPLLYRYFPNKEALLDRVYQEVFVAPWKKQWEDELADRRLSLETRLTRFYRSYAKVILTYDWIRLFMFAGLKGLDFNARYLSFLRKAAFELIVREIRFSRGLSTRSTASDQEIELVWGLHASIFYIGVRQFIYGMSVPTDMDADLRLRIDAFLRGAPEAVAEFDRRN